MAEYSLIDSYLGELSREVGRIRHAEEILEEVADHLLEAVAMQTKRGADHMAAQRRALIEFGDPELVGNAFASSATGGIAVPTEFTKRAGVALIVSGVLWLAGLVGLYVSDVLDRTNDWESSPQVAYAMGAYTLTAAAVLLVIGIAGINRRHGGALGLAGRIAFWVGIPTAFVMQAPWAWGLWTTGFAIVGIFLSYGLIAAGLVPRFPARMIGVGAAVTATALWAFQLTGTEIEFGAGAATAVAAIGIAIFSLGLTSIGSWLRAETPADEPSHMATA